MRKKDKITISVVGIILVGIVGMWGMDFSSEYLTVTEVKQHASDYISQSVEITGKVKPDTLTIVEQETIFKLTDGVSDITVIYHGDPPQALAEGAKVSVRGILVSGEEVNADMLVMGCPSKYGF
jgi:cytochrome c-type biogenesis protein CcmE